MTTNDLIIILKYFALFLSGFYSYLKLSSIKIQLSNLIDILFAFVFAIGLYYATVKFKFLIPIILLIILCLFSLIRFRLPVLKTLTIGTISCGITIFIHIISYYLCLPIVFIVYKYSPSLMTRNIITACIMIFLQIILTFLLLRIKRFKSGVFNHRNDGYVESMLLASILIIFSISIFYTKDAVNSPFEFVMLTIIFCGLAIILLLRQTITHNYRKQLSKRNEMLYEQHINTLENENAELIKQNAHLSKIIHRDNKLIPAITSSVKRLLNNRDGDCDVYELLDRLEYLSKDRNKAIDDYKHISKLDDIKTGNITLDAVISFLHDKAKQNNVNIHFNFSDKAISSILEKSTDKLDLNTVLCDLGENAIISTKSVENRKILIAFEIDETSHPFICFYDNGEFFDEKVLSCIGRRRITTHKDDGGSGFGLMTIFEILHKYDASFCLNECLKNKEFTKYIKIIFDGAHNITILPHKNDKKIDG